MRVKVRQPAGGGEPVFQVLAGQIPVVDVLEVKFAPPGLPVPPRTEVAYDGQVAVVQILINPWLALPALLVGVVGLLGPEVLEEQGQLPAVFELDGKHVGARDGGKGAGSAPHRADDRRAAQRLSQRPLKRLA
jgi:hypothetical protein